MNNHTPLTWYHFTGRERFDAGAYHIVLQDKFRTVNIMHPLAIETMIPELTDHNYAFMVVPDYDWEQDNEI